MSQSASLQRPQRSDGARRLPDKYSDPSAANSPPASSSTGSPPVSSSTNTMTRKAAACQQPPVTTKLKKSSKVPEERKDSGVVLPPPHTNYGPRKLEIYPWEHPIPKPGTFTKLSNSRREWKKKIDSEEAANDIDEGLECWDPLLPFTEQCLIDHGKPFGRDVGFIIAVTFVIRAKRAFWAGQTWEAFSADENEQWCEDQSHELRMDVFRDLAGRLCNEIWLEEYPGLEEAPADKADEVEEFTEAIVGDLEFKEVGPELLRSYCVDMMKKLNDMRDSEEEEEEKEDEA